MISDYNTIFKKILSEGVANATLKNSLDCHLTMLQMISQYNNAAIWINTKAGYDLDIVSTSVVDKFLLGVINRQD